MGRKRIKFDGKAVPRILLLIVVILLSLLAINKAYLTINRALLKTETVRTGTLKDEVEVMAFVARNETVYWSKVSGKLDKRIGEGEKIGVNTTVVTLQGEGTTKAENKPVNSVVSTLPGIVSYNIDQWETVITPETIEELDITETLEKLKNQNNKSKTTKELVNSGEPLFKVMDNLKPIYLGLIIPKEAFHYTLAKDDYLNFSAEGEDLVLQGKIIKQLVTQEKIFLVLEISSYGDLFIKNRLVKIKAINEEYQGLMIPKSALAKDENNADIVYKVKAKKYIPVPVEVIGKIKETIFITGLKEGEEIVINPQKLLK